jgi:hypothetical protein
VIAPDADTAPEIRAIDLDITTEEARLGIARGYAIVVERTAIVHLVTHSDRCSTAFEGCRKGQRIQDSHIAIARTRAAAFLAQRQPGNVSRRGAA